MIPLSFAWCVCVCVCVCVGVCVCMCVCVCVCVCVCCSQGSKAIGIMQLATPRCMHLQIAQKLLPRTHPRAISKFPVSVHVCRVGGGLWCWGVITKVCYVCVYMMMMVHMNTII